VWAFGKTKNGHDSFSIFPFFFGHVNPLGVGFIGIWCALGFPLSSSYSGKKACRLEHYTTHIEPNEIWGGRLCHFFDWITVT
jgi:hypothetical protein